MTEPIPISRQQRRALDRRRVKAARPTTRVEIPALCEPGHHGYNRFDGPEGSIVYCVKCGRTIQDVFRESPKDRELYVAWLEHERRQAELTHSHVEPDPDGLPVDGCPGCARLAALAHSDPDEL